MKKIIILIISIFTINVKAANIDVILKCPTSVYENEKISCTINLTSDIKINGIKVNYEITNGTYESFNLENDWISYASNSSGFAIGNTLGKTGNNILGTVVIKPTSNKVGLKLKNIDISDMDFNSYNVSNKETSIEIKKKEEIKPVPDDKNNNSNNNNNNNKQEYYLDSLEIEGYEINFNKTTYTYEIEVLESVNNLNIKASSKYKITGIGKVDIKDKDSIKIIVNNTRIYEIKIKRIENITNKSINEIESVRNSLSKYDEVIIELDEGDKLIAFKNILDLIKGENKKIIYNIYNKNNLLYTYIFDGNKIKYVLDNIDLKIEISNLDQELKLNMNYKSYLPEGTILKIYNIKLNDKVNLYRYNLDNNLELVKKDINVKKELELEIERGDNYLLRKDNSKTNDSSNNNYLYIIISILVIVIIILVYIVIKNKNKKKVEVI